MRQTLRDRRHEGRLCADGGQDWNNIAPSQGHQEQYSSKRETRAKSTLVSGFPHPQLQENAAL